MVKNTYFMFLLVGKFGVVSRVSWSHSFRWRDVSLRRASCLCWEWGSCSSIYRSSLALQSHESQSGLAFPHSEASGWGVLNNRRGINYFMVNWPQGSHRGNSLPHTEHNTDRLLYFYYLGTSLLTDKASADGDCRHMIISQGTLRTYR